jgi:hypothetical protein
MSDFAHVPVLAAVDVLRPASVDDEYPLPAVKHAALLVLRLKT